MTSLDARIEPCNEDGGQAADFVAGGDEADGRTDRARILSAVAVGIHLGVVACACRDDGWGAPHDASGAADVTEGGTVDAGGVDGGDASDADDGGGDAGDGAAFTGSAVCRTRCAPGARSR